MRKFRCFKTVFRIPLKGLTQIVSFEYENCLSSISVEDVSSFNIYETISCDGGFVVDFTSSDESTQVRTKPFKTYEEAKKALDLFLEVLKGKEKYVEFDFDIEEAVENDFDIEDGSKKVDSYGIIKLKIPDIEVRTGQKYLLVGRNGKHVVYRSIVIYRGKSRVDDFSLFSFEGTDSEFDFNSKINEYEYSKPFENLLLYEVNEFHPTKVKDVCF